MFRIIGPLSGTTGEQKSFCVMKPWPSLWLLKGRPSEYYGHKDFSPSGEQLEHRKLAHEL